MNQKTDLTLMRYCGHFLIKVEGGAKNYKRLAILYRRIRAAKGLIFTTKGAILSILHKEGLNIYFIT